VLGYGVWALAWATLAQALVKSAILLMIAPHPAAPYLGGSETRQLLNFGIGLTLSRLATFAAQNGDYFVVARWLGTASLGLYSRAYQLMCLPIYQFSAVLNSVLFPAYASIQTDAERLRRGYLTSLSLSAVIVFPVLTTMAIVAPELMTGVFGPQWAPAAVPLQILCVGGACYCIYNLADSLVRAKGAVYVKFFYHSIYAVAVFGGAFVGRYWGITGVSVGVVVAIAMVYGLMAHLSLKLTDCSWRLFFRAQLPAVTVSGAVGTTGLVVATILRSVTLPPLVVLLGTAAVCCLTAFAAGCCLPRGWHSPIVLSSILAVRKHIADTLVATRRRYDPETI
jgi:O-antigen/teichoic acid export membrane protein